MTVDVGELPTVMGDPTQLARLLQNLLSNALKFRGEATPHVTVRAERDGQFWCFSVSDNGIGFAAENASRIFEMFQRLHERGKFDGTGLGLAICKRIVEQHGGTIWAEAQDGQGSKFYFRLPALYAGGSA